MARQTRREPRAETLRARNQEKHVESEGDTKQVNGQAVGIFLAMVCRSFAVSVEVFLHGRFGARYLMLPSFGALVVMALYSLGWPDHDLRPLFWFAVAFLAACALANVGNLIRWLRGGVREHSYYTGWPHLLRLFPRWSESIVKRIVEPLAVIACGALVTKLNPPLGLYLVAAGFALALSTAIDDARVAMRANDMRDALIEQQQVAERFRGMSDQRLR